MIKSIIPLIEATKSFFINSSSFIIGVSEVIVATLLIFLFKLIIDQLHFPSSIKFGLWDGADVKLSHKLSQNDIGAHGIGFQYALRIPSKYPFAPDKYHALIVMEPLIPLETTLYPISLSDPKTYRVFEGDVPSNKNNLTDNFSMVIDKTIKKDRFTIKFHIEITYKGQRKTFTFPIIFNP